MPSYSINLLFSAAPDGNFIINPLDWKFTKNEIPFDKIFLTAGIWLICFDNKPILIGLTNKEVDVRDQWIKHLQALSFRGCDTGFVSQPLIHLANGLGLFPVIPNLAQESSLLQKGVKTTINKLNFAAENIPTFQGLPFVQWPITFHLFTYTNCQYDLESIKKNLIGLIKPIANEQAKAKLKNQKPVENCKDAIQKILDAFPNCLNY